jgi:hypothetical protein
MRLDRTHVPNLHNEAQIIRTDDGCDVEATSESDLLHKLLAQYQAVQRVTSVQLISITRP